MIIRRASALLLGLLTLSFLAGCEPVSPPTANQNETKTEQTAGSQESTTSVVVPKEDDGAKPTADTSEVDFNKAVPMDNKTVLTKYLDKMIALAPEYYKAYNAVDQEDFILKSVHFYDVGTIKVAPFAQQKLVAMVVDCDGPCFSVTLSRFAWNEQTATLTYLDKMSNEDYIPDYIEPLRENANEDFNVKALDLPNTILLPDGSNAVSMSLRDADFHTNGNADESNFVTLGEVAFTDPKWGNLYFADHSSGCVYLPAPDGSIATYGYDPKLLTDMPFHTVIWHDGSNSSWLKDSYLQKTGGCGIMGGCYMVEPMTADQLIEAGKTDRGVKMYLAKDTARITDEEKLIDDKVSIAQRDLNITYNTYVDMFEYLPEEDRPSKPVTYDEFLASKPIIYWQDPFGRYSGLIRSEYRPPAECGKPVIYLYPEQTTEISVKVDIDEFTVTEPDYGTDGWKVIADTESNILNLADGQTYPYLFWEGISSKSLTMSGGFVVAKGEVDTFLTDSLGKLGLNEKESADFREFWVSKMEAGSEPYLLVSFAGTSAFNQIAPLDISPAPDTLIRVFMYYQPLWQPISIPKQKLTTLERKGFTVVEWGGTSSDGWQSK